MKRRFPLMLAGLVLTGALLAHSCPAADAHAPEQSARPARHPKVLGKLKALNALGLPQVIPIHANSVVIALASWSPDSRVLSRMLAKAEPLQKQYEMIFLFTDEWEQAFWQKATLLAKQYQDDDARLQAELARLRQETDEKQDRSHSFLMQPEILNELPGKAYFTSDECRRCVKFDTSRFPALYSFKSRSFKPYWNPFDFFRFDQKPFPLQTASRDL
jgi:hypothetical protein